MHGELAAGLPAAALATCLAAAAWAAVGLAGATRLARREPGWRSATRAAPAPVAATTGQPRRSRRPVGDASPPAPVGGREPAGTGRRREPALSLPGREPARHPDQHRGREPAHAVRHRADCLTPPVGSQARPGAGTRWGGDDSRSRAVRDVRAGVDRGRRADPGAQWEIVLPPLLDRLGAARPTPMRDAVSYYAYDDACVPDLLAGRTSDAVGPRRRPARRAAARRPHRDRRGGVHGRAQGRRRRRRWCTPTVATSAPGTTCWS